MAKSHTLPGFLSVADFATQLQVHVNTVYGWRNKGWISFDNRDGVDADKALADLANSPCPLVLSAEAEQEKADEADESRAEADRRRAVAQADREELKSAQERGELVQRSAVQAMLFSASRNIRDRLMAVAARVAPRVAGVSDVGVCARLVDEEISEALEELVPESLRAG